MSGYSGAILAKTAKLTTWKAQLKIKSFWKGKTFLRNQKDGKNSKLKNQIL